MPVAINRAVSFIDRNTRHPMKVVGLNRIRLDEYPVEALREALVNAIAHRQYNDAGRKILLEVFADRVILFSPGLPPAPITLANLRFRRMRDQMLNHGLDQPLIDTDTGYFQVTFPRPGESLGRLRVTPAVEARLNERQRKILAHALEAGAVTTGWCIETLGVVRDTAHQDLVDLVKLKLLDRKGSGRGAAYVPNEGA